MKFEDLIDKLNENTILDVKINSKIDTITNSQKKHKLFLSSINAFLSYFILMFLSTLYKLTFNVLNLPIFITPELFPILSISLPIIIGIFMQKYTYRVTNEKEKLQKVTSVKAEDELEVEKIKCQIQSCKIEYENIIYAQAIIDSSTVEINKDKNLNLEEIQKKKDNLVKEYIEQDAELDDLIKKMTIINSVDFRELNKSKIIPILYTLIGALLSFLIVLWPTMLIKTLLTKKSAMIIKSAFVMLGSLGGIVYAKKRAVKSTKVYNYFKEEFNLDDDLDFASLFIAINYKVKEMIDIVKDILILNEYLDNPIDSSNLEKNKDEKREITRENTLEDLDRGQSRTRKRN